MSYGLNRLISRIYSPNYVIIIVRYLPIAVKRPCGVWEDESGQSILKDNATEMKLSMAQLCLHPMKYTV